MKTLGDRRKYNDRINGLMQDFNDLREIVNSNESQNPNSDEDLKSEPTPGPAPETSPPPKPDPGSQTVEAPTPQRKLMRAQTSPVRIKK